MKDPVTVFSDFLTDKDLRLTSQRALILSTFLRKEGHITSEELYDLVKKKDRSIGQATVYRTLKLLSESGIAREIEFGDGVVRYEHKYGHDHHDHLICQRCGRNVEVIDQDIERLQEKLAKKYRFKLTGHKMYLYGLCEKCRRQ